MHPGARPGWSWAGELTAEGCWAGRASSEPGTQAGQSLDVCNGSRAGAAGADWAAVPLHRDGLSGSGAHQITSSLGLARLAIHSTQQTSARTTLASWGSCMLMTSTRNRQTAPSTCLSSNLEPRLAAQLGHCIDAIGQKSPRQSVSWPPVSSACPTRQSYRDSLICQPRRRRAGILCHVGKPSMAREKHDGGQLPARHHRHPAPPSIPPRRRANLARRRQ